MILVDGNQQILRANFILCQKNTNPSQKLLCLGPEVIGLAGVVGFAEFYSNVCHVQ